MIDLVIDPRDPELEPLGPSSDGSKYRPVQVTVATSRDVRLTAGGFVLGGAKVDEQIPVGGSLTVSVPATDGAEVLAADRSTFEYVVTLTWSRVGKSRDTASRTFRGLLPTSLGATVQVTELVNSEPLPAPFTSFADFEAAIVDQIATTGTAANDALIAEVGAVTDPATASLVTTASATRTALDGRFVKQVGGGRTRSAVTASGSGGANQAAAINAELSALSTFGGGILELAGGLHDNLTTITVPAYCTLRGAGWSVTDQSKGTVLRFAAGQSGVVLAGQASGVEGASVISKDNGVAGSSVGVTIGHLHCTMRDVNVGLFGSHGIKCDSTAGGARNEARIDNVRSYGNGGCGLFIDGSDSNSGWVTALDLTGNKGAAQLFNEGSRWIIWAHIDSAGVGGTTDAVWDNAIANTYNVYVESSVAPGSNFHLGSSSVYGTVEALYYAKPIIVADVVGAFLSWRIYDADSYRFLKVADTYGNAAGKSWRFDSGLSAAGRFRLINTTDSRTAFEVDGGGTYMSFAATPIPSPDNGVDLGRTANRWRNQFLAGYVEVDELAASPAAPAANKARLFVKDNGAGKTQLVVRFNTGAEVVLATEA